MLAMSAFKPWEIYFHGSYSFILIRICQDLFSGTDHFSSDFKGYRLPE